MGEVGDIIERKGGGRMMSQENKEKQIRAVYTDTTIRVYQAYCPEIAEEAVRLQTFGSHFSLNRMTWIKPSFLWMMYRCGWAGKEGQERVLAIDLTREGFDSAVKQAVLSSYKEECGLSREEWKKLVEKSDVRVQWDPEKDVHGNNLPYRSIQIGLRGQAVRDYVEKWIVRMEDITEEVKRLDALRHQGVDIVGLLPKEEIYVGP
ncbi:MAG: DUF4291 domain-containing protein [Lachnospiraceae bacterium]|nr:DUF4291 domain-containing protein [Lachnospiraceae bacterium]